jgi:flagellar basal body-associated protein FliL
MKQKDIVVVIVVIVISCVVSVLLTKQIFGTPAKNRQKVPNVPPISASFQTPDPLFVNSSSKDVTQIITIGPGNNTNPF